MTLATITPRKWQESALLKVAACAARPRGPGETAMRAIVTAWMGSGKTEFAFLLAHALGRRVLFVVNTDTLADQTERRARKAFPDMRVGVVKGKKNERDADFVVASLQTIDDPARLAALVASEEMHGSFDLVVVDECHGTFEGGGAHLVLASFPRRPALGLTATPWRLDKKDLAAVWRDGIVYKYGRKPAEADGVIVPICDGAGNLGECRRVLIPDIDVKAAIAAEKAGDKDARKRAYGAAAWPVVARELAHAVALGRRAIGFCPDVESSQIVADLARQLGLRCEHVDGDTKRGEKKRILAAYARGELDAVVNCNLLAVGFDDVGIGACVWARATDSWSLFWQALGRVIRTDPANPAKKSAMLTDCTGSYEEHGSEATETLFMGEDSTEPTAAEVEALSKEAGEQDDRQTAIWCGFLKALAGKRLLASQRKNVAWLPVGKGDSSYAIGGSDGATYIIERGDGGLWRALREPRRRKGDAPAPATALTARVSLEAAQAAAEAAARAGESFDARDAQWREREATEEHKKVLAAWRIPAPDKLTAGEVSDALVIAVARKRQSDRHRRGVVMGGGAAFE